MEIFLQIIGFSFIPLLTILVYGGLRDIFSGLKEYYSDKPLSIIELPFKQKACDLVSELRLRKINTGFCQS